jgi:hypothetical protein
MLVLLCVSTLAAQTNLAVAPRPLGMIGRMAAASDGPRQPIPDTLWVRATTGVCDTAGACIDVG